MSLILLEHIHTNDSISGSRSEQGDIGMTSSTYQGDANQILPATAHRDSSQNNLSVSRGVSININSESDLAIMDSAMLDSSILRMDTVNLTTATAVDTVSTSRSLYASNKKGIELPEVLHRSDGILLLLLFCFLIIAHVYHGSLGFVKDSVLLAFSPRKAEKLDNQSQTTTSEMLFSYFLVFQAILLISISLYEGLERFTSISIGSEKTPFIHIGAFMILISVFIFLKLLLNKFVGYIFDQKSQIVVWNKTYLLLLGVLGLLCFLPTLILVYSNWWHGVIIGFSLFLFLVVQLILIFRLIIFFISQRYSVLSLVAYLLTVEIIPYIYLGLGLLYIYQIDIFNSILGYEG